MDLIGIGIDVVETARIARMMAEHRDRFMDRVFTPGEQAYGHEVAAESRRIQYFAGRFAAKEAILKALGTGWRDGIAWTDAEILRRPSGEPVVEVHGQIAQIANRRGITHWRVSISHTEQIATASAIATGL